MRRRRRRGRRKKRRRKVNIDSPPAKVTQLEDPTLRVEEEVLWLDVSVTHTISMNVG